MVQLRFETTTRDAPHAQTLAKNYLDLLWRPLPNLQSRRSNLVMVDDEQVDILTVEHVVRSDSPQVSAVITPLRVMAEDLALYGRAISSEWDLGVEAPGSQCHAQDVSDVLENHAHVRREIEGFEGPEEIRRMMVLQERLLIPRAQRAILELGRVKPHELMAIYGSSHRDHTAIAQIMRENVMVVRGITPALVPGAHPAKAGDSRTYRSAIDQALEDYRRRYSLLFPLRVPVCVTILNTPPVSGNLDLDNLARWFVGRLRDAYRPPATLLHGLSSEEQARPAVQAILKEYPTSARTLVPRYEVYTIPRTSRDPPEGYARVSLGPADWDAAAPWDEVAGFLELCDARVRARE